ncbi:MAG TPA: AAA family ATPase, partial [Ktedonobacteraceae bacterium]|nr:AAA family ATPase [Ktedonobacteraceae bacterium]
MVTELDCLHVTTLGRFSVARNQVTLSGGNWNRRRVCELFKILLSVEQHRLHREQVQELLWPDFSIEQAANSFGKTLYLLRRALEPALSAGKPSTYIALDQDILMLVSAELEIDVDLFEARARYLQTHASNTLEDFDNALNLYGGDYLPDDLYTDWTQRRRDRLRRIYSWLLEQATQRAIASAQGQRASEYLYALVEQNILDEALHRELMLIYARIGRRGEALNRYQMLCKMLQEELQTTPASETVELYRAILDGHITADLANLSQISEKHQTLDVPATPASAPAPARLDNHTHSSPEVSANAAQSSAQTISRESLDRSNRTIKTELVGRSKELQRLQEAYESANKEGQWIFFVSGEAGIGKTRLAREYVAWAQEQQAAVLWGTCDELSGALPYQPIIDMLAAHMRASTPEQLRVALGQHVVDLAKILPELSITFPELPSPGSFGHEVERRNLYNAVVQYLHFISSGSRLLLVLDDLQWVDTATAQLLSYILNQSAQEGTWLFVLLLYRADEVHETHPLRSLLRAQLHTGRAEELRLKRLKEKEVQQLLSQVAGHEVRSIFADEIYKHTEGNPFFIGESLRALIEEGKLKKIGDRWQTTIALKELALPQSVLLLIERRLANLSPECRTTLAYAALLGRHFHSSLLSPARNLPEEQIAEHVDEAIRTYILTM